jgi:thiol-disulfide isomerase/thioredoxin
MRIFLTWGIITVVICTIAWMVSSSFEKIQKRTEREQKSNTLPELNLFTLDSLAFGALSKSHKPLILIYFNTSCEHCHYEILSIKNLADEFKDVEIIFFSTEPLSIIRPFASAMDFEEHSNIHFAKISFTDVTDAIGTLSIPHIFVYGPDKKLWKEFKGETKPEAILKYIH